MKKCDFLWNFTALNSMPNFGSFFYLDIDCRVGEVPFGTLPLPHPLSPPPASALSSFSYISFEADHRKVVDSLTDSP